MAHHQMAGLGPKDVTFRRDRDYPHFSRKLAEESPPLGTAGGYSLFTSAGGGNGSQALLDIPMGHLGYTPSHLSSHAIQGATTV